MAGDHGVVGVDVSVAAVRRHRTGLDLGAAVGVAVEGGAAPLARFAREARAGADAVHVAGRQGFGRRLHGPTGLGHVKNWQHPSKIPSFRCNCLRSQP